MKKTIFLAASAAFFVSGVRAADVVPNHIRHPLHAAAVKMLVPKSVVRIGATAATASSSSKYVPTLAPGGLSNENLIAGLSWPALLGDTATYADNSVQQADIGSTVAPLDANGNSTAPVSTAGNMSAQGTALLGKVPAMGAWTQTARASFFTNNGDISSSPHLIHFGGLQDHADAYLNLIGYTMGHADNSGSILTVQDTDGSFYGNRSGAGGTDSVLFFSKINGSAPRLEAGAQIADTSGVMRTVTFGVNSFTVSPAFSAAQLLAIQGAGRIRVFTNWKNGNVANSVAHTVIHPNEYFGYTDPDAAVTANGSTTFTVMTDDDTGVLGWRTETSASPATTAPGLNPGDTLDNTADTASSAPGQIWSYSEPAVFIGMADHKFLANPMVQLSTTNDAMTRHATWVEPDMEVYPTRDYQFWVEGLMMAPNSHGYKLTDDSKDAYLGGDINHHLILDGACGNWDLEANGVYVPVPCNIQSGTSITAQVLQEWDEFVGSANNLRFALWNEIGNSAAATGFQQAVTHLGPVVDGYASQTGAPAGSRQGDIEWQKDGNIGSISLCGYAKDCGFRVNGDGTSIFNKNAYLNNGVDLTLFPATPGLAAPYLHASGASELTVMSNAGGRGNLLVNSLGVGSSLSVTGSTGLVGGAYVGNGQSLKLFPTSTNAIGEYLQAADDTEAPTLDIRATDGSWANVRSWSFIPIDNVQLPSKTLAALGTGSLDGEERWCSDCTLNGVLGVAAVWHATASKWTDSQNGTLSN
ncbi:hypothetical protein GFGA_1d1228 [Gluconobacter frateurii NBRC 103465]|nr:hypothetical protein GFGA_1d1228 [Gluconobacter frateurii NBRC 103465]